MKHINSVMQQSKLDILKNIKPTLEDVKQELVLALRKTRDIIEKEQEFYLSIEQASMLFDVCKNLNLTDPQTIFVIGKNATDNYGLFSFSGDVQ